MIGGPEYDTPAHRRWDRGSESDGPMPTRHRRSHGGPDRNPSTLYDPRQLALLPELQGDLFEELSSSMVSGR